VRMLGRLGVRPRLLLAFLGISIFAIIAAATAFYSFLKIGSALDEITEQKSPSAIISLELSRHAERVVTAAPTLLTVSSGEAKKRLSAQIAGEVEALNRMAASLSSRDVELERRQLIKHAVAELGRNLQAFDELVSMRLLLAGERKRRMEELLAAHRKTQRLFAPWTRVLENKIKHLRDAFALGSTDRRSREAAERSLTETLTLRTRIQTGQKFAAGVYERLLEIATSDKPGRIAVLSVRAQKLTRNLAAMVSHLDPKLAARLGEQVAVFRGLLDGRQSLPALRIDELAAVRDAEKLLAQNKNLSRQLTAAVDGLVDVAKGDISTATLTARAIQRRSSLALAAVVGLSVLCSVAIGLHIARGLIARLTGLSASMLAIAQGDLEASIPDSGHDEIGQMAEALVTFRDNARELKEANIREVQAARARLIDAIESVSEGFSLFDSDDRLVICNKRYQEMLFPNASINIHPGMTFESIARLALQLGYIRDAEAGQEAWLDKRLATHRGPGEPQIQRRTDGRWILISERRTEDGGIVGVYSDITEMKEREDQLSEKSLALETLANQLAKYLSPQVYQSIFSGKQEVRVASKRKKLTVFFSDIADFTITTEKLESEELTNLLNHYLEEMSGIALAHGATIDKYVGDAIIGFFGDPETRGVKEDALACVQMALSMRDRLRELDDIWQSWGIERPFRVRIGVNTGFCTVGNFGSEDRMDYTIIGGGVNLAARLQQAAPLGEILVSYETYSHVKDKIYCKSHDQINAKGITDPVATYKVVDSYERLGEEHHVIHEKQQHLKIDADLDAMSPSELSRAMVALRSASQQASRIGKALGISKKNGRPGKPGR
jgi:adenylate cyclase